MIIVVIITIQPRIPYCEICSPDGHDHGLIHDVLMMMTKIMVIIMIMTQPLEDMMMIMTMIMMITAVIMMIMTMIMMITTTKSQILPTVKIIMVMMIT